MNMIPLTKAATELRQAKTRLEQAKHRAADLAEQAARDGIPETEIARILGVNRLTVRSWLGK